MNKIFTERPLSKTGVFGLLLLPLLVLINEYSPSTDKVPAGYSSSILAFEFVSDQKELEEVLSPLTVKEKRDLDKLNYVDFGFMTVYGIFLFLFVARLGDLAGNSLLIKAKWIAPVIVVFDVLENIQLLRLSKSIMDVDTLQNSIAQLGIYTWCKWGLLSLCLALIGYAMTQMKQSKWTGYVLLIPLLLGICSFVVGSRKLEDLFGTSIFLGFFIIFAYCFFYKMKLPSVDKM